MDKINRKTLGVSLIKTIRKLCVTLTENTQGWTNYFLGARLFSAQVNLRTQSGMQLNGPLKTKVNILVTTRNVAFCFLLRKYPLQLSFLMHFHQKLT